MKKKIVISFILFVPVAALKPAHLYAAEQNGLLIHQTGALLRVALKNAEQDYQEGRIDHAIKQLDLFKEIIVDYKKDEDNPVLAQILADLESLKTVIDSS